MDSVTVKFEAGKAYTHHYIGDFEIVKSYTVERRTSKFVWLTDNDNPLKGQIKKKVSVWNGAETCQPEGNYSMSPTLRADDLYKQVHAYEEGQIFTLEGEFVEIVRLLHDDYGVAYYGVACIATDKLEVCGEAHLEYRQTYSPINTGLDAFDIDGLDDQIEKFEIPFITDMAATGVSKMGELFQYEQARNENEPTTVKVGIIAQMVATGDLWQRITNNLLSCRFVQPYGSTDSTTATPEMDEYKSFFHMPESLKSQFMEGAYCEVIVIYNPDMKKKIALRSGGHPYVREVFFPL